LDIAVVKLREIEPRGESALRANRLGRRQSVCRLQAVIRIRRPGNASRVRAGRSGTLNSFPGPPLCLDRQPDSQEKKEREIAEFSCLSGGRPSQCGQPGALRGRLDCERDESQFAAPGKKFWNFAMETPGEKE
jgi:hypothetical protein